MRNLRLCLLILLFFLSGATLAQDVEQPDMAGVMTATCDRSEDINLDFSGGIVYLHVPQISEPAEKIKSNGSKISGEFCDPRNACKNLQATLDFTHITDREVSGTYDLRVEGWQTTWKGTFRAFYAKQTTLICG